MKTKQSETELTVLNSFSPGYTETLSLALFHEWRPGALLMILAAYLDGSGTEPSDPLCVVAGYLSSADRWRALDVEWGEILSKFKIDYYHAVDVFHGKKQFHGWPKEKRDRLNAAIGMCISKSVGFGFATVLQRSEYREVFGDDCQKTNSRIHNEFALCFLGCLRAVSQLVVNLNPEANPSITFVLESGDAGKGYAVNFFDRYKVELLPQFSELIQTICFENKRPPGIQAADYIAYHVLKEEKQGARWPNAGFQPAPMFARNPLTRDVLETVRDALDKIDMHVPLAKRTKL